MRSVTKSVWTSREKILAAAGCLALCLAFVGWGLFASLAAAAVPDDAAAKVDDVYITEDEVSQAIEQYRTAYSLTDDSSFASALTSQNLNASSFRQNIINEQALSLLIDKRAKELDLVPTDEEIEAGIESMRSSLTFGDSSVWEDTLSLYGMTEESVRSQVKVNLEKQALYEREVTRTEATDDDGLSYAQNTLAGVSQKHVYRIMFTGDDASERARECSDKLQSAAASATLSVEYFSQLAKEYSDEENVAQTGGSFAWSVEIIDDDDLSSLLDTIDVGEASEPSSVASDNNAQEILYCDTVYEFPDSSSISELSVSDVPASLWDIVLSKASEVLYNNSCDAYLSNLLARAKITYYPMPDDASYNVTLAATASAGSSTGTAQG